MGLIRHTMTTVGAFLVAFFAQQAQLIESLVSGIPILVGLGWSFADKTGDLSDKIEAFIRHLVGIIAGALFQLGKEDAASIVEKVADLTLLVIPFLLSFIEKGRRSVT